MTKAAVQERRHLNQATLAPALLTDSFENPARTNAGRGIRVARPRNRYREIEKSDTISSIHVFSMRFKLLNRNVIDDSTVDTVDVCNNQVLDRSQTLDFKDGEMSEWLKEHAWK